jgi:pimeloyl-ACP methyl ester carboxylesterase
VLAEPPALTLFTSVPPRPPELLWLLVRRPRTALAILSFGTRTHAPDGLQQALGTRWDTIKAHNLDLANTPAVAETGGKLMELFATPAIPADVLARIAPPTTLIWGRHDLATPVRIAEAASRRHGWPLHVIEDAADDPTLDQPEAFLNAMRNALGQEGR